MSVKNSKKNVTLCLLLNSTIMQCNCPPVKSSAQSLSRPTLLSAPSHVVTSDSTSSLDEYSADFSLEPVSPHQPTGTASVLHARNPLEPTALPSSYSNPSLDDEFPLECPLEQAFPGQETESRLFKRAVSCKTPWTHAHEHSSDAASSVTVTSIDVSRESSAGIEIDSTASPLSVEVASASQSILTAAQDMPQAESFSVEDDVSSQAYLNIHEQICGLKKLSVNADTARHFLNAVRAVMFNSTLTPQERRDLEKDCTAFMRASPTHSWINTKFQECIALELLRIVDRYNISMSTEREDIALAHAENIIALVSTCHRLLLINKNNKDNILRKLKTDLIQKAQEKSSLQALFKHTITNISGKAQHCRKIPSPTKTTYKHFTGVIKARQITTSIGHSKE